MIIGGISCLCIHVAIDIDLLYFCMKIYVAVLIRIPHYDNSKSKYIFCAQNTIITLSIGTGRHLMGMAGGISEHILTSWSRLSRNIKKYHNFYQNIFIFCW